MNNARDYPPSTHNYYISQLAKMFGAAILFISATSAQKLSGSWPPGFQVPATNVDWTSKLLSGAQIPNLPVTTNGSSVWDTSLEIVGCKGHPDYWALTYDDGPGYLLDR